GVNSLRGFNENSILQDGGLAMLMGNIEARIPLRGPFGAEVYMDVGNVWSRPEFIKISNFVGPWDARRGTPGDLRYSYGVGGRLLGGGGRVLPPLWPGGGGRAPGAPPRGAAPQGVGPAATVPPPIPPRPGVLGARSPRGPPETRLPPP